ncbi:efflux RND transporter periplasmic adaptor subunit [Methylomarinum sp. Ch1-1]|uniref:Efflux RND transporter periplasmic adaptor subunit n=1 Tax=Methylomarinum roseum TaxID=3067653 RepID=A0AAU7NTJ6_9GAMM|nr:efflux RND transporter periplasmic adaptor subunit [Methylomarinum sp. Ch1-1]MDP4519660.1 efflux RND transporter periplasmic adaptor subunit [Methylomarinum sp. Ch1-1]
MIKTIMLSTYASLVLFSIPLWAQDYTELDCLVKPEMYIDISSPVDGVLESVLVNKSDRVTKGQELAKLEASVEAANVEVAAQEARMGNLIHAKKLHFQYAQRKMERIADLFRGKVSSTQEYDEAATEVALAKSQWLQSQLDKRKNELKLALAKAQLEQKTIKSPINGIVVERYLMPGESVENQPILQLAKIDPLMVEVVAPAELFGKIQQNMAVEVYPDIPVNSNYQATVSVIDRMIDAASGSFSIRLSLPNPDDKLIGGSKCIARFAVKLPASLPASLTGSAEDELPEDIQALLTPKN